MIPGAAHAAIEQIAFTTDPQTVAPSAVSAQITIEAQDGSGVPVSGNSVCMHVTSSSPTGEFSTNETNWSSPVATLALTLSTSQFRRNFYYRDATSGAHTISVQAGSRPGSSCSGWTPGASWSSSQSIVVGAGTTGGNTQTATTTTATSTPATATTTTSSAQKTTTSSSAPVSSYVLPPLAEIFADGGDDRTVIVGADSVFRGRAYNRTQDIVDKVRFNWNFGDGTIAEGMSVEHHFKYPGRYAVVLNIAEHFYAASDRIIVTAVPAQILFVVNDDASVSIENQESRDIDIGRWMVRSFGRFFTLPEDTVILAGETLRIPQGTLGFSVGAQTELLYPNGTPVVLAPPQIASAMIPVRTLPSSPMTDVQSAKPPVRKSEQRQHTEVSDVVEEEVIEPVPATSSLAAAAAESIPNSALPWWLGAGAIALVASGAAYVVRRMQKNEWNIIDESA